MASVTSAASVSPALRLAGDSLLLILSFLIGESKSDAATAAGAVADEESSGDSDDYRAQSDEESSYGSDDSFSDHHHDFDRSHGVHNDPYAYFDLVYERRGIEGIRDIYHMAPKLFDNARICFTLTHVCRAWRTELTRNPTMDEQVWKSVACIMMSKEEGEENVLEAGFGSYWSALRTAARLHHGQSTSQLSRGRLENHPLLFSVREQNFFHQTSFLVHFGGFFFGVAKVQDESFALKWKVPGLYQHVQEHFQYWWWGQIKACLKIFAINKEGEMMQILEGQRKWEAFHDQWIRDEQNEPLYRQFIAADIKEWSGQLGEDNFIMKDRCCRFAFALGPDDQVNLVYPAYSKVLHGHYNGDSCTNKEKEARYRHQDLEVFVLNDNYHAIHQARTTLQKGQGKRKKSFID
eukprot:CAMPEP_0183302348 /NCGR_PEP_ID=MMETSP0160_2-20130417/8163_1 /TAXON_ID=2839 ORGANISM="Odontella Sinensis, Strain Grunow 1884" /NCGR_SAMPLE_ID=MMETSP0160_2 /ASSEMBLY_ACC=CAM_ASM_000250 /LENGTH=406 /DNA_ID=CAMNT_0025465107 /DNA_START=30 /DNA_END=1250 /DNA_ORIENTATION=-